METKATEGRLTATVKATGSDGAGSFEAILSEPTLDRDNEILDANAFAPLPERITIDVDHGMSVESTVGSGQPYYEGDALKIRGTFASTPLGQTVRTLVKEGHIDSMSVAYRAAQYEDDEDGIPHLRKAELLNAAIVAVPSNREALITAAKSAKADVQHAHDEAVALGAECKHVAVLSMNEARVLEGVANTITTLGTKTSTVNVEVTKTATDPEEAAATAAAPLADVALALVELTLAEATLAL